MTRALTLVGIVLTLLSRPMSAQSARSYVSGSVGLARPQGALHDSLGLNSTAHFDLRYIWSPTRNLHLGIGGSWLSAAIGSGSQSGNGGSAVSLTQITATATWRPFKHSVSPCIGLEGGFGFLIPPDELLQRPAFESTLGASFGAHIGGVVPVSQLLELTLTGRWTRLMTSTPLDLKLVSIGLTYRIQ